MVKTYAERGNGRVKVFFLVDQKDVKGVIVGNQAVINEQGFQFYVDDYVADQIDKCEFYLDGFTPKLRLKEGETLEIPTEVEEKEREIKELEQRLKQLRGDDDE